MPNRSSKPKRPRDANQLAKRIVDISTGQASKEERPEPERAKDPAAVELGRRGGLKGGIARAQALSPEKRRKIARQAAKARWGKKKQEKK